MRHPKLHWCAEHGATALMLVLLVALFVITVNGWWT